MSGGFTPGPWVCDSATFDFEGARFGEVAYILSKEGQQFTANAANARLIAAPTLFEALEATRSRVAPCRSGLRVMRALRRSEVSPPPVAFMRSRAMDDVVQVEQVDRKRAAEHMRTLGLRGTAMEIERGERDLHFKVQEFARHRIAAFTSPGAEEVDALTLRNAREWIEEGTSMLDGETYKTGWAHTIEKLLAALSTRRVAEVGERATVIAERLRSSAASLREDYGWHHPSDVMDEAANLLAAAPAVAQPGAGEVEKRVSEIGSAISDVGEALGLFPSVIKSGETWSPTCEEVQARARSALSKLGELAIKAATLTPPAAGEPS